jgi:intracellular septation protein A
MRPADFDAPIATDLSKRSVAAAVTKRLIPHLVEATLIPTAMFYALLPFVGLRWALLAALGWSGTAVARRIIARRRIPALLLLTGVGLTVRTAVLVFSGNTFVFFLQPIIGTLVTAVVLTLSVAVDQPLIARFAADFCPLSPEVEARPEVVQLFRRLTYLWAAVNVVAATMSLLLLVTVPVEVFVGTRTVAVWAITCTGVGLTITDAVRTARTGGLATAVAPDGGLHAFFAAPAT